MSTPTMKLQVTGITCLDCAQKFEKAVGKLPGVIKASLNTMTGTLIIEGVTDLTAIRKLGKEENYTINTAEQKKQTMIKPMMELQVTGITCLDCAQKFEKAVGKLSGVIKASLNTMTGTLIIEGVADLAAIRKLGKEENYKINTAEQKKQTIIKPVITVNWQLSRAILSGICVLTGLIMEKTGAAAGVFFIFYLTAIVSGGWGNFKKAFYALPRLNFNMSVLMSTAVIGALAIGQYEEGATVAFLFAISEMLESWTMERAQRSIRQLMNISPKTALIRRKGVETEIPVEEIMVDDIMIVAPGAKIAMDGVILKGETAVNQASITGESIPAEKGPGSEVFAGTLNTYGSLEVKVTKLVTDTAIAKIIHMVENAQNKRAPSQAFVDKFAAVYTPIVMIIAACIILVPPLFLGYEWAQWIYRGLVLLVIACPCALVVSTPVAIVSAISTAAKHGVLIKGGIHLEETGSLNAVAFDKTGTLTKGKPVVTDILPMNSIPKDGILQLAANLESRSEHPLALAILKEAEKNGFQPAAPDDFCIIPGRGAKATINAELFFIGNPKLFLEMGMSLNKVAESIEELQQQGKTVMLIGTKNVLYGLIAISDEIRENSNAMIKDLKKAGIRHTIMLTGDNKAASRSIAGKIEIDEYKAELLPEHKLTAIQELIDKYGKVAMVGDGINDAPALALSTVGIAMGGAGTDTALETADIALMADDLSKIPFVIKLSRKSLSIIRQNITFSLVIKAVAILAVFPGWMTLWLAILADMGASLLVTLNSLRLLNEK